ncbi:DUF2628 domain-containing protein [Paracraurococcus ruber]|uniref:DUF2628 domain-containing protein n=1 Tax=Paracraurococcus ruber TaxID=77675 RepID=A0ABS1D0I4_9PROT|nr:DUF2628 domain-containing protein [Paracraurococcus ruber]MBK1659782.1 hypothetical protein [Paracraurococcus ruber]TDG32756.1 DUF2628 domain-containing protein [Paracraurococcus ruber]
MRIWTVHLPRLAGGATRMGKPPVLVREGFSWAACLLALPWLLWHRLWLEAIGYLGLILLLAAFVPRDAALPVAVALQFLLGAQAQDLRRAALTRRGRPAAHVVAAPDEDLALARLLEARPDLARTVLA